jgi:hypothetical protein
MVIVKRHKDRLTFTDNGETRTGENGDVKIRVPLDVLDMVDDIRQKTGLTRSRVLTEMITFAYERTEIIRVEGSEQ